MPSISSASSVSPAQRVLAEFKPDFARWDRPTAVAGPDTIRVGMPAPGRAQVPMNMIVNDTLRGVRLLFEQGPAAPYRPAAADVSRYIALLEGVHSATFDHTSNTINVAAANQARAEQLDTLLLDTVVGARVAIAARS